VRDPVLAMKKARRRKRLASASTVVLALLLMAGTASAVKKVERVELRFGDLVIIGHGGFRPETLPKHQDAPIEIYGGGKLSTVSGELPPILNNITFEFDRHGSVDTTGLAVCRKSQLVATDVPAARRACGDAIVGKGFGTAVVKFPEQGPIPASTGNTLFNGPKKNGFDTVLVHAHLDVPAPSTVLFEVVIEKVHNGVYGYRAEADIPKLVNGYGHPISGHLTIARKWTYKGKKHSYANARCETGRLQARGEFGFEDGTLLSGTFFRPCKVLK
jgi:hypothetical protein